MRFPTPPPLRTKARPVSALQRLNPSAVRLVVVTSIVFWMVVMGLLGAVFIWLVFGDMLARTDSPIILGACIDALIALTGFWIGNWTSHLILHGFIQSSHNTHV